MKLISIKGDFLKIYLDRKVETGVKINSDLRHEILNLEKNFGFWEEKGKKFELQLSENNKKIQSLKERLNKEKDLYILRADHDKKITIRQISKNISRLIEKNRDIQSNIKKYQDKIGNGRMLMHKFYTLYRLEYYIRLHQKLWDLRYDSLKPGRNEKMKIRDIHKEIETNPMFNEIDQCLSILDQGEIYDHFKAMKLILSKAK